MFYTLVRYTDADIKGVRRV